MSGPIDDSTRIVTGIHSLALVLLVLTPVSPLSLVVKISCWQQAIWCGSCTDCCINISGSYVMFVIRRTAALEAKGGKDDQLVVNNGCIPHRHTAAASRFL